MNEESGEDVGRHDKLRGLLRIARYRPGFIVALVTGGIVVAMLEAVGMSFILPIVEIVNTSGDPAAEADGVMLLFVRVYEWLGIPFTLGYVIVVVSAVLTLRWTATFVVRWLREALVVDYTRELKKQSFNRSLDARIEYIDQKGSDDILNAIVTQAEYGGRVIIDVFSFIEKGLLALMYLLIAFVLSPALTLSAVVFLGGLSMLFRYFIEPGYELGDKVADANELIQQVAQAGIQGIRDTKLFGLKDELFNDFLDAVNQYATSRIRLRRNEQAIQSFYNLLTAISVFTLIYLALTFADMSLGALGVFLFAMFRLAPQASGLNSRFYKIENRLPHLIRTQEFIVALEDNAEPISGSEPVPDVVRTVEFDNVSFSYDGQEEDAVEGVSFTFEKGEFIGFVGQSGAGKSTIAALLARMYEPDGGEIRVNGRPIHEMDIDTWRSRIAVVRQDPFIYNDTLRYNLTIGNRSVTQEQLDRVSRTAKIDEFYDELPNGYDTELGDDGVRLSGGQRQRVALARGLLKDAEILVLDEATSDLDSNLEKQVQTAIENMNREYTIVGIAHRLSTLENADIIYTMSNGNIIEYGRHETLLKNEGPYAELYSIQSE